MTHPRDWRDSRDPAHLFLSLWRYVNGMVRQRVANAVSAPPELEPALVAALASEGADQAVAGICDALQTHWDEGTSFVERRSRAGLALEAMRAIDHAMLAVHPRSIVSSGRTNPLPAWLNDTREARTLSGSYADDAELSLIARGPFARSARMPLDQATFSLIDQFACLKVIDLGAFLEDGKSLNLHIRVIDHSVDRGVPHKRDRAGSEVVTFAPLAEAGDDLVAEVIEDANTMFIDVRKGAGFDPVSRFLAVVAECRDSDIVIAPELTVEPTDVAHIAAALAAKSGPKPRVLLPGSGLVPGSASGDLPFNQATVLNGNGATLWDHRKVSAYAMQEETSKDLDIDGAKGVAQLMERIAWSDSITVGDIDGLGRCIVLICQDLKMGVVQRLLEEFRPDWVLVPILDSGTSLGRWPAKHVRDLAPFSEARFIIVSSLTMKAWTVTKYPGEEMGVAVGPAYINSSDTTIDVPSVQAEVSPDSRKRRYGSVRWRSRTGWQSYRKSAPRSRR
jgi:hypothetical protein